MVYSHGARDLKDRHDIYSFIPSSGGYAIPHREYRASANLSAYLKQAGWFFSSGGRYALNNSSDERRAGDDPLMNYALLFSGHSGAREYKPAGRLEERLFLN